MFISKLHFVNIYILHTQDARTKRMNERKKNSTHKRSSFENEAYMKVYIVPGRLIYPQPESLKQARNIYKTIKIGNFYFNLYLRENLEHLINVPNFVWGKPRATKE